jgi:hypothetical protein
LRLSGPRRHSAPQCPSEVKAWASDQAGLLAQIGINDFERYLAAMNVAEGGDPTPIATILIGRKPTSLAHACDELAEGKEMFAVVGDPTGQGPSISLLHHRSSPGWKRKQHGKRSRGRNRKRQDGTELFHRTTSFCIHASATARQSAVTPRGFCRGARWQGSTEAMKRAEAVPSTGYRIARVLLSSNKKRRKPTLRGLHH